MSDHSIAAALAKMKKRAPEYVYCEEAHEELGMPGAMLSGSKRGPGGETVYWNACVFNAKGQQVWHGDLNLTRRSDALQALADRIGAIHVTPEQPFRFEGLSAGRKARPERIVTIDPALAP